MYRCVNPCVETVDPSLGRSGSVDGGRNQRRPVRSRLPDSKLGRRSNTRRRLRATPWFELGINGTSPQAWPGGQIGPVGTGRAALERDGPWKRWRSHHRDVACPIHQGARCSHLTAPRCTAMQCNASIHKASLSMSTRTGSAIWSGESSRACHGAAMSRSGGSTRTCHACDFRTLRLSDAQACRGPVQGKKPRVEQSGRGVRTRRPPPGSASQPRS
jgi:hypothetical protein